MSGLREYLAAWDTRRIQQARMDTFTYLLGISPLEWEDVPRTFLQEYVHVTIPSSWYLFGRKDHPKHPVHGMYSKVFRKYSIPLHAKLNGLFPDVNETIIKHYAAETVRGLGGTDYLEELRLGCGPNLGRFSHLVPEHLQEFAKVFYFKAIERETLTLEALLGRRESN